MEENISLAVLCPNKEPNQLKFDLPISSSVDDLRRKVSAQYGVPVSSVRLIYRGRLLNNNSSLSSYGLNSTGGTQFIHCSISSNNSTPPAEEIVQLNEGLGDRVLGFGQLRDIGFTEGEVQALRNELYARYLRATLQARGALTSSDLLNLEERIMSPVQNPTEIAQVRQQEDEQRRTVGSHYDLFVGLVLGFFFGVFVLLFVWEELPLTTRRQFGMTAGVCCNVFFAVLQHMLGKW
eukprot:TRINITY_DN5571_c0_g1_i3.p1 TRINITY_DN5571_c0_g1~~TRINITY_DN5571_c0_g1_i3.p1  ORF type:complete len:248 (-),score=39.79 TRINITY_DN5571_c0_g1_i3:70-777(-)